MTTDKSKVVAGILAILLPALGAHKFYMENSKAGLIWLLTSWFCLCAPLWWIVGLIEGIMILVEDDEKFAERVAKKSIFI